jgi:uroporphyrinogen-III decarboxylase
MDYNAYCSGHLAGGSVRDPAIAEFPDNFHAEAAAFGVETGVTLNGFPAPGHVWTEPSMLNNLPMLDKTPSIQSILQAMEKFPPDKTVLLKVNCPYSILASLVEPSLFYRWLRKNKNQLHTALAAITSGLAAYILKALKKGIKLLSFADPYANMRTLGRGHYNEFAAHYLVSLLNMMLHNNENTSGLIHVCPYNSIALEELNLITTNRVRIPYGSANYIGLIDCYIKSSPLRNIIIAGHQCIYAKYTDTIITLNLKSVTMQIK